MIKKLFVEGIKATAKAGSTLKASGAADSALKRLLVDAALFPLDALAAQAALRSTGAAWTNIIWPRTFNAKIMYHKLFRRKSCYTLWADKVDVREYVRNTIGDQYLSKLLWVGSDLSEMPLAELPNRFVIKASHGSGMNMLVKNKRDFDLIKATPIVNQWLATDFSIGNGEWQYRWIEPRILIEEFLEGPGGESPWDYRFFCFHGKAKYIQVDFDIYTNPTRAFYDRNLDPLYFTYKYPLHREAISKPPDFTLMLSLAEALASDEPFVRIDLYDVGKPIFGEITLHPLSGSARFDPPEWDSKLGQLI